ncbi:hypothetical protein MBT84_44750 [Streptomyces sp. MBT84]|nr:hypothetical protein [Streptomyces sp. MBT84]
MIRPESGVLGAGFRMIGAPAAIAGATLWAHWFSGKLNGVIPSTTPSAPIPVEYAVIVVIALILTLTAYELLVRRTRATRFLFGMRP